jgi:hypothetical protein
MVMKKIILTAYFLTIFVQHAFSVDSTITDFYPLSIGNSWTYWHASNTSSSYRYKTRIVDTVRLNSQFYYMRATSLNSEITYLRVDSLNGNLLQYTTTAGCSWLNYEILIDSLAAKKNDPCSPYCAINWSRCTDTPIVSLFNIPAKSKNFITPSSSMSITRKYAYGFGYYYYFMAIVVHIYSFVEETLLGCVINGNVYGDTPMPLGITKINSEIPEDFSLSQNYPNPFNPLTKIRFDIPKASSAKLIIYDLLGREIKILVNEELKSGTYEAEWDASGYSSGIYFYSLITDKFIESKKMVLIK